MMYEQIQEFIGAKTLQHEQNLFQDTFRGEHEYEEYSSAALVNLDNVQLMMIPLLVHK